MSELKGFKFVTALILQFRKKNDNKTIYNAFYSNSKAETVVTESDIDDVFKSVYTTILLNTHKSLAKVSC